MVTIYSRYVIEPHNLAAFEHYGKLWIHLVNRASQAKENPQ